MAAAMLMCAAGGYCEATGSCAQPPEAPLHERGKLAIQSIPAGVTIVGTDSDKLRITCTSARNPHAVRFHLGGESGHEQLTIDSDLEHENNLQIRLEVPHRTSVRLHMGAGQVRVNNLEGDKDIDLYAGQITIATGDTSDYRSVRRLRRHWRGEGLGHGQGRLFSQHFAHNRRRRVPPLRARADR